MKFLLQWVKRACVGLCFAGMGVSPCFASAIVADVVYYGGMIYTFADAFTKSADPFRANTVELVAVKDGKIVFAGEMDQAQRSGYLDAARVGCFANLNGKTMMPGFVASGGDGHMDATVFAAAGITTMEQYGVVLADELPRWQQAASDAWPLRVIIHPEGGGEQGARNRDFLGWPSWQHGDGNVVSMQSDITASASFPQPERAGGIKPKLLSTGADMSNFHRSAALFPLKSHQLFLGAWRLALDTTLFVPDKLWRKSGGAPAEPVQIDELLALYHSNGQSMAIQAAGDEAMEKAVTALENAVMVSSLADARHTIFPASMTERQHVARLAGRYDGLQDDLAAALLLGEDAKSTLSERNWTDTQWQALASKMRSQRVVLTFDMAAVVEWGQKPGQSAGWAALGAGLGANLTPAGWSVAYEMPFALQGLSPSASSTSPVMEKKPLSKGSTMSGMALATKAPADSWMPLVQVQAAVLRLPRTVTAPQTAGSPNSFATPDATPLSQLVPQHKNGAVQEINGTQQDMTATFQVSQADGSDEEFWQYDQRVNVLQALHGVTAVPAFRNHLDRLLGTIEVGKLADFVILDRNPLEIAFTQPLALEDIPVHATIVGGSVVFGRLDCTRTAPRERLTGDESLAADIRAQ